jgi:hypothetical protein
MGVKISGLTAKGATIADTDLVEVSQSAGAGLYTSRSVTGANIKALVTDANMTTSDITTNDVSTAKHGFAPKAPNDTTKFLRGDGTWAVPAGGGLTEFTEAETTAAPNATVPVNSLTPVTATTNADFAVKPKGTGAILAAIPDNTTANGNKRGQYAVDLQIDRSGASAVASGNNSVIIGGSNNTASGSTSTVIGGASNVASGPSSIAGGVLCTASGSNSVSIGYISTASGNSSVALGGSNASASATQAIAIGRSSTASGTDSIALSTSSTASGPNSVALGANTISSADSSASIGSAAKADGICSSAIGCQSSSLGIYGRIAFAGTAYDPLNVVYGSCQKSLFLLRVRTTNATATTLTSSIYSGSAGTTNQVILPNQSAYRFKGTIVGKQSGSVNAAVWDVDGFIVRGANAAATTLNVSNVTLVQNTPAWGTPTLAADTTNGGLRVQVIGAASTNIQWTCTIETTEVIYA